MFGLWRLPVRGKVTPNYKGDAGSPWMNNRGDVSIAQGLPPVAESVRLGDSWMVQLSSGPDNAGSAPPTAFTPIAFVENLEQYGIGKSYVIDYAEVQNQVGPVTGTILTLMCGVMGRITTGTRTFTTGPVTPISLSGKKNYTGKALCWYGNFTGLGGFDTNQIARPVGRLFDYTNRVPHRDLPTASAFITSANNSVPRAYIYPQGMFTVPPGGKFAIVALLASASGTWFARVFWHEVYIPMNENS